MYVKHLLRMRAIIAKQLYWKRRLNRRKARLEGQRGLICCTPASKCN